VPPAEPRQQLDILQARLVASLVAGGDPPAGMDRDRIRVQAAALAHKRAREVARTWPQLAAALGTSFVPVFRDYARFGPKPARGGAVADAGAFARYLCGTGRGVDVSVRRAARKALRRTRTARIRDRLRVPDWRWASHGRCT